MEQQNEQNKLLQLANQLDNLEQVVSYESGRVTNLSNGLYKELETVYNQLKFIREDLMVLRAAVIEHSLQLKQTGKIEQGADGQ